MSERRRWMEVLEIFGPVYRPAIFAACCWLGMMWVHELGHVAGCFFSGGTVDRVVLAPWGFSRTDLWNDPHPLVTVWSGPVLGAVLPLMAAWMFPRVMLLRLLAGFCLLANGAYVFFGSFERLADAGAMLKNGSPLWMLWGFGLAAMAGAVGIFWRSGAGLSPVKSPSAYRRGEVVGALVLAVGMAAARGCFFQDGG